MNIFGMAPMLKLFKHGSRAITLIDIVVTHRFHATPRITMVTNMNRYFIGGIIAYRIWIIIISGTCFEYKSKNATADNEFTFGYSILPKRSQFV